MIDYSLIVKPLIDTFKNPLIELLKDLKAEAKYFFDSGLPRYIAAQYEKYNLTKTFIHRTEPVEFKSIYFPVTISLSNKSIKLENDVWDIFSKSNYIGIMGIAGSGKSMLMKHLYLNTVETYKKIPIVIELRDLNEYDGDLLSFVYKTVLNNKLSPNTKILERLFESGSFLLLLDGYDEINFDRKYRITREIDEFIDKYNKNYYVISSRPGAGLDSIPRFSCYHVKDLNNNEIENFIKLQIGDNELKLNKIIQTIALPENKEYRNYLKNPLLLSMFILTFETYPQLPKNKSTFYWNVFDTLCTRHDSITKKGVYLHERKTKLLNDELEDILKYFCYIAYFEGRLTFDYQYFHKKLNEITRSLKFKIKIEDLIYDLTVSISIIIIDGLEYKLPHKSLQEYFAASLISEQTDSDKQAIYSDKFNTLKVRFEADYNFWNLCYEMDNYCFLYYFILPNLYKLDIISGNKIKNIIKMLISINMSIDFMIDNSSKTAKITSITTSNNIVSNLLNYYNINYIIPLNSKKILSIYKIYKSNRYKSFLKPTHHKEVNRFKIEVYDEILWEKRAFKNAFKEIELINTFNKASEAVIAIQNDIENDINQNAATKTNLLRLT